MMIFLKNRALTFFIVFHAINCVADVEKAFVVKAFNGDVIFPSGFYFDVRNLNEEDIFLSNGQAFDSGANEIVKIKIGTFRDETKFLASKAKKNWSCYGFKQNLIVVKSDYRDLYYMIMHDDKTYISMMSYEQDFWFNSLIFFKEKYGDVNGQCFKGRL